MLQAFGEAIGPAYKSTVELTVGDELLAYGAIIDADGWLVSKDSQLPAKGHLVCRLWNGEESDATIVSRNSSLDVALLHIERRGLQPLQWADDTLPPRGSWVATTGIQQAPVAFGVVSAGLIAVKPQKVRMGVVLREDAGAIVEKVYYGTGADKAGLRTGDRIRAIDGRKMGSQDEALKVLQSCRAGQCVQLTIVRGEDEIETEVRMMDLSDEMIDETEMEVNGSVSARSSGFTSVFLHDTVLSPNQCGGPLVNLDGQVVGLNIARAGRVCSYALPTSVVRSQINQMLSSAKSNQMVTTK
jgi:serine protease Do